MKRLALVAHVQTYFWTLQAEGEDEAVTVSQRTWFQSRDFMT